MDYWLLYLGCICFSWDCQFALRGGFINILSIRNVVVISFQNLRGKK